MGFNLPRKGPPSASAPPPPPPPPWQQIKDPSSGQNYYYNRQTGESQWTIEAVMASMRPAVATSNRTGIPMPDPELEPERYEIWKQVTHHIESGDRSTASESSTFNASRFVPHCVPASMVIPDALGLRTGDGQCGDFRRGECRRGSSCKYSHGEVEDALNVKRQQLPKEAAPAKKADGDADGPSTYRRVAALLKAKPDAAVSSKGQLVKYGSDRVLERDRDRRARSKERSRSRERRGDRRRRDDDDRDRRDRSRRSRSSDRRRR